MAARLEDDALKGGALEDGALEGKVALVTGASSGIGRAAARALAAAGARVALAARREERGREVVREIEAAGGRALFVRTDVTVAGEVDALVARTVDAFGGLDVAFNNAGVGGGNALHEASEADWDAIMDVNLKGVWLCMRAELRIMLERGGGVIVNNASVAGTTAVRGLPIYGASKAAVISLTRSAARAYGRHGVRVNALCPGFTASEMTQWLDDPEQHRRVTGSTPLGRVAAPEEMAGAVVWLASDAAAFMTGQALVIDGGIGL